MSTASFHPPSDCLTDEDGIWKCHDRAAISYPEEGNDDCFRIEDESWWFRHRNDILVEALRRHPPAGLIYDIGGGNGFQSHAFERAGFPAVVVEPGSGARNARERGLTRIVQASLSEAGLESGSIAAVGMFDVLEHVEDEFECLEEVFRILKPGGRLFLTVPALSQLWSDEDVSAGHYRRYSKTSLSGALERGGFCIKEVSYFFLWPVLPIFCLRSLPFCLRSGRKRPTVPEGPKSDRAREHRLPGWLEPIVCRFHQRERALLDRGRSQPFGSSLLAVATKPDCN